ncbi:MAG: hypothetical protein AAGL90_06720 [Pseudomonadota bacterium]
MDHKPVHLPHLATLNAEVTRLSDRLNIALAELRATKRHACKLGEQSLRDRQIISKLEARLDWMERRMGRNSSD